MTYGGDDMARRRKKHDPVPTLPRTVRVMVRNRCVAEIAFGDDPGLIVPGSVAWLVDPAGVTGPDREAAAANVVRVAGLDPKESHDVIWQALWSAAPRRA